MGNVQTVISITEIQNRGNSQTGRVTRVEMAGCLPEKMHTKDPRDSGTIRTRAAEAPFRSPSIARITTPVTKRTNIMAANPDLHPVVAPRISVGTFRSITPSREPLEGIFPVGEKPRVAAVPATTTMRPSASRGHRMLPRTTLADRRYRRRRIVVGSGRTPATMQAGTPCKNETHRAGEDAVGVVDCSGEEAAADERTLEGVAAETMAATVRHRAGTGSRAAETTSRHPITETKGPVGIAAPKAIRSTTVSDQAAAATTTIETTAIVIRFRAFRRTANWL